MHERKIWELAGKVNAGEATATEKNELERLLLEYPEIKPDIDYIAEFWRQSPQRSEQEIKQEVLEKLMLRIQKHDAVTVEMETSAKKSVLRYIPYAAAAITVLMCVAWLFIENQNDRSTPDKTITVANGTKTHLTLPDGSKVWLNAGSSLKYNAFSEQDAIREVTLSGEAYFEVVHREHVPFIIHTDQVDIKDIGTAFNVRAYPNEGFSETTLIEGAVEIIDKNKERTLLNKPRQKMIVYDTGENRQLNADRYSYDSISETAWIKDVLVFKNETFQQLALRMERYYDIQIVFENASLLDRKITGTFSNETFQQAFASLQLIIKFQYSIDGRRIIIR